MEHEIGYKQDKEMIVPDLMLGGEKVRTSGKMLGRAFV